MPQKNKILGRPWPQFSVEDLRLLLLDMRCFALTDRTQFGRLAQCHGKDKVSTLILYDETSQVSIMLIIRGLRKAYEDIPLMEVQFLCMTELNDPHECWQEMMDAVEATMEGGNKWMSLKIRLLNAMLVKEMLLSNAAMLTPDARAVRS
ncbi:hypothetical protein WJX73_008864 [Symbiochloris irregularis]|uniref:Uncharacterized protein n=1 Tax=Symbiochloris irregularis TaxID=706552 RepID=A0AAW1PUT7_9CHLO